MLQIEKLAALSIGDEFFIPNYRFNLTWRHLAKEEQLSLAASDVPTGERVMEATLKADFGAITGILLYKTFEDALQFVVEDISEFHANQMTLLVWSRRHEVFESPPFRPRPGEKVTIVSGEALFVDHVEALAAKVE